MADPAGRYSRWGDPVTLTDAEKQEAIDAAQAAGFKVETGPKVKDPEKIALVKAAEQVLEPEPAATPETVASVPEKQKGKPAPEPAGEGIRVELWGDMSMKVYPEAAGTFLVEFLKGDCRVCIETPKSPPWLSPKLQGHLVTKLIEALGDDGRPPTFMRRKVGEAFADIKDRLEADDGTKKAMTPAPVRRMIEKTQSVIVYPGESTLYEVTIDGRTLTIKAAQMARIDPGFINLAILNAFPLDPLDASKNDWKAIKNYWLSPELAEVRDVEEATEAEIVIDQLRVELESVSLVESPDLVNDDNTAWRDPGTGEVWVPARRITRFLDETAKKPGWSSTLSKEARAAGWMKTATRTKKMGNPPRETRCWVFVGGFTTFRDTRNPPANVSEYVENIGGGNR